MTHRLFLFTLIVALALWVVNSRPATSQSLPTGTACFEITLPSVGHPVTGPILLNKCTGTTHILTRFDRGKRGVAFEWVPIATGAPPDASAKVGRKCFTFDGRHFCP